MENKTIDQEKENISIKTIVQIKQEKAKFQDLSNRLFSKFCDNSKPCKNCQLRNKNDNNSCDLTILNDLIKFSF